jgi:light-regulated signal transduction histidine kinase (bacteriophytochrome)
MSEVGSGNLQYRTDVTKSNEVGILQIEVNSMAEHLEELNTKRKALFDKIQERNHELQHFAHIAAHDLQEPLRMITSYLQLLQRRHTENFDDEAKEFMGFVIGGANRMQALIQALHAYSSVESDKEANPLIDVNSKDIVDWAVDNVSLLVKDKGATVNVTGITPDLYVCKVQVAQVLQNLLGNALKYCPEDRTPEVTVDVKDIGSHIQFSVKDNGIGIEEQYYQKIFEVFRRLHGSGEFSGTGMGLSVCKRIVDRHKGKIWVESKYGEGSTFYFTVSKKIEDKANE